MTAERTDDLFGGNKPNFTGVDPLLNGVEKSAKRVGNFAWNHRGEAVALAALPLTAVGSHNGSETTVNLATNLPTIFGTLGGVVFGAEEAFEEERNLNISQKVGVVTAKTLMGFTIGYSLTHNLQHGNLLHPLSWVSGENLPYTIFGASQAYVMKKETSIPRLVARFTGRAVEGGKKTITSRRQISNYLPQLDIAVRDALDRSKLDSVSGTEEHYEGLNTLYNTFKLPVYVTKEDKTGNEVIVLDKNHRPVPNTRILDKISDIRGPDGRVQLNEGIKIMELSGLLN